MTYNQADPSMQEDPSIADTDDENEQDSSFVNSNLAEDMDEEELTKIGDECSKGFEQDLRSRSEWEDQIEEWIDLAKQTREVKSYPWPNASNVKYPLLSTAAMQFAARAYPSLVPANGQVVNCTVIGRDPGGSKLEKANNVATYMSYQVMDQMDCWEEDMDRLLLTLPIVGTLFKKTWYDKAEDKVRSELVSPKNLVVDNWAKSLYCAERVSEICEMTKRVVTEKMNLGFFKEVDLEDPTIPISPHGDEGQIDGSADWTTPYQIIEQHTFYDKDEDGYAEPYIVTFERNSKKVLRMVPRYYHKDITMKQNGKGVAKIEPIQMYTKFSFIPNPDNSFYDLGFGTLLGPLNESINTLINQLVDAGHVANLQSGFIGKALRMKMGDARMTPGEWRPVNATGDDLRKQIVPLPAKEPSNVLLELMGNLITSGKELASVAEIFTGKMPGQNTPATTTMASIEQGMKVFTAVYKRIYRSLAEEFDKIFDLNFRYLDPQTYVNVLDIEVDPSDFDRTKCDIEPSADPSASSAQEKQQKAQALLQLMQMGPGIINPVEVFSRILQADEQPDWQQLFTPQVQQSGQQPPPPPDPKIMAIQAKMQADQNKAQLDTQSQQQKMELDARDKQQQMAMRAQEHAQEMQFKQQEGVQNAQIKQSENQIKLATAQTQANHQAAMNQQQLAQNQEAHVQKLQQAKETSKLQQKSPSKK
jgi:chaperonin GroES